MNTNIKNSEYQCASSKDTIRLNLINYIKSLTFKDQLEYDMIESELKNLTHITLGAASLDLFVDAYKKFVDKFPKISKILFALSDKGGGYGGPGEVLAYFAIDDIKLGGPASRCDVLYLDDTPVAELKGVKVLPDGAVTQFQLGIAAQPAVLDYCRDIVKFLDRYYLEHGEYPKHARGHWTPSNPTEVAPSILQLLRDKDIKLHDVSDDIAYLLHDMQLYPNGDMRMYDVSLGNLLTSPTALYNALIEHVKLSTPNTIHDIDKKFELFVKNSSLGEKPFAFISTANAQIVSHGYLRNATYIKPYQLTQRSIKPMIKF